MATNKEIAHTILQQLGGNAFVCMTGARSLSIIERGLSFRLPSTMTRNRIAGVRVVLDDDDTYKVTFLKIRKMAVTVVGDYEGVYCDGLADLVSEQTGLVLQIPRFA